MSEPELDGSPLRRLGTSVVILVCLVAILSAVMPSSGLRDRLLTVTEPVLLATGLDQRWGMFAPDPRSHTSFVVARTENADGSSDEYVIVNDGGPARYWNYRWLKYGETLWSRDDTAGERAAFARWVAERQRERGRDPVAVTLIRRTTPNLPPGPGPDAGPTRDVVFFSVPVSPR